MLDSLASQGSLTCDSQFLDERGYDVRRASRDEHFLHAERREGRLGTPARREWIEVQLVPDSSEGSLRGRAWAVDSTRPSMAGLARRMPPL
jgi:hypothetical protein